MEISMRFSGKLAHPSAIRSIEDRLRDLEAELLAQGFTGTLSVSEETVKKK